MLTTKDIKKTQWRLWGASIRGSQHDKKNLPNQDAINWEFAPNDQSPVVMAISDGHGSPSSFRSEIGSRIAVESAVPVTMEYLRTTCGSLNTNEVQARIQSDLLESLLGEWQKKVKDHIAKNPFSKRDLQDLEKHNGLLKRKALEDNPFLAYGATLLLVGITNRFILYLQLGDGEILCVNDLEDVYQPIPSDPELIANETHSLCMPNAKEKTRFVLESLEERMPSLVLLCTDGYSNSFDSSKDFYKIGPDYLKIFREEGLVSLKKLVPSFLKEASQIASGDDVTLGLIKRSEHFDIDTVWAEIEHIREKLNDRVSISDLDSMIKGTKRWILVIVMTQISLLTIFIIFWLNRN